MHSTTTRNGDGSPASSPKAMSHFARQSLARAKELLPTQTRAACRDATKITYARHEKPAPSRASYTKATSRPPR
jgi:hypothetical protein